MKKQSRETPRRRRVEARDRQVEEFERRDLGYQTMLKLVVREHLDEY